jgi:hypothetical protein
MVFMGISPGKVEPFVSDACSEAGNPGAIGPVRQGNRSRRTGFLFAAASGPKRLLGNFPQAFSRLALIHSATVLSKMEGLRP